MSELRRLIVRHRHVAPMVSALLAVDRCRRHDPRRARARSILERGGPAGTGPPDPAVRQDVVVDGDMLGWVEGGRAARGIAAVLAYAAARERDKRSLANEALERYRELSLIYDLAATIGGSDAVEPVVHAAVTELSRLPHDARGFVLLADGDGGTLRTAPGADGEGGPIDEARAGRRDRGRGRPRRRRGAGRGRRGGPARDRAGACRRQPGRGGPAGRRRDPGRGGRHGHGRAVPVRGSQGRHGDRRAGRTRDRAGAGRGVRTGPADDRAGGDADRSTGS